MPEYTQQVATKRDNGIAATHVGI